MGQVWEVAIDPTNEQIMYAGSNSTGMWKSTNGGTIWTQINVGLSNLVVQALAISKSNPEILMCGTGTGANAGVYLTADGGASWFQIITGIAEASIAIQALAIDPTNPEIAYCANWDGAAPGATNGIYKTTNAGLNWSPAATGIGTVKNFLSFAINPLNPRVVYAGSSFAQPVTTDQARIYKSTNSAASWVDMSSGLPATQGLATHDPIRKLSIQASDTNRVLAAVFLNDTAGGAYLTTNGGALWVKRSVGLPADPAPGTTPRAILIRPGTTNEFYIGIGTERGIYRTTNAGLSWTSFNNGALTDTATVRQFAYAPTSRYLYAGAAHASTATLQGVFRTQLSPLEVRIPPKGIPTDFVLQQNYPNPFNPGTKIEYGLPERAYVTLKVYDVLGREVATLVDKEVNAGYHQVTFDGSKLSSGLYFYRLSAGKYTATKRLMLLK
jgi:photosystem II stability/assembly factor-like uncharacterized protein